MSGWPLLLLLFLLGTVVGILWLMFQFASYPDAAREAGHDPSQFSPVMAGRYGFMALVLSGAILSANLWGTAYVLLLMAGLAFWDRRVYAQAGLETDKHVYAGCASLALLAVVVGYGLMTM